MTDIANAIVVIGLLAAGTALILGGYSFGGFLIGFGIYMVFAS